MAKCDDVKPRLSEALSKELKKKVRFEKNFEASNELVRPLAEKHTIAVTHAAWVRKYHEDGGTGFPCNPSTEVDRLIAAVRGPGGSSC